LFIVHSLHLLIKSDRIYCSISFDKFATMLDRLETEIR
jgi:hypothetical protein